MKNSSNVTVVIGMLLLALRSQAFAMPVNSDLAVWRPEIFERAPDTISGGPYVEMPSKFLVELDRSIGSMQDVWGVTSLQAAGNLRLLPWKVQGSGSRADVNPILSSRLTQKLIAPMIDSVKFQVGWGIQSDGTVFVRLRNISKNDVLLNANLTAPNGTARTMLIHEGRPGIVRPLDANLLLSTTLIGEFGPDIRPAAAGKTQKIVEQSLGYKFFASENLQLTVGRHLGGARFDTAASVQEIPPTNVVKIDILGNSVVSYLPGMSVDDRRRRGFVVETPLVTQERSDQNRLTNNENATIFYSNYSSVLVNYITNIVVITTSIGHSGVYPAESRQSRALFLSRLKINSAATSGMITNSLVLP